MAKNILHCSFCGRSRDEVKILIAGQEGHICENCVEHAREIIEQELMVRDEKTPSAFKLTIKKPVEIKKFLAGEEDLPETAGLRVRVVPGGCSGFQYSLNIEEESRQGDFILEQHGIRLFVDMFSAQYLNGVTVDYTSNMMGSGFTFENPNATGGCGCGTSFSA